MRHIDFDYGLLLHAVSRYCTIQEKGGAEHFYNDIILDDPESVVDVAAAVEEQLPAKVPTVFNVEEDASNFRAQGFGVDDDNEPAPENIPQAGGNTIDKDCEYFAWGEMTLLEERSKSGVRDVNQCRRDVAHYSWVFCSFLAGKLHKVDSHTSY